MQQLQARLNKHNPQMHALRLARALYGPEVRLTIRSAANHLQELPNLQPTLQHIYRVDTSMLAGASAEAATGSRVDRWQYNQTTASGVAAILPGDGTQDLGHRDVVLHMREGGLRRISELIVARYRFLAQDIGMLWMASV